MRLSFGKGIRFAQLFVCLLILCSSVGCESLGWGRKKTSTLSLILKANGFEEKKTTFALIGDHDTPSQKLPIKGKKLIWNAIYEAYPVESWKWKEFYDIELKSEDRVAHLYVRDDDSCALFFHDLPVDHPDFFKDNPHIYFLAPGIHYPIVAETMKAPEETKSQPNAR
ncbi:MAG: hypothetical protein ACO1QB_07215 [Verrucomicrobiales bacterium]